MDVGAALAFGATRVEAVEVNAGVARLVLGPLAAYGGDLFREPGVRLVLDEGRGYLHRSPRRYDAIVLTAVDSWAALASGAYSLAESYLYTSEAMDALPRPPARGRGAGGESLADRPATGDAAPGGDGRGLPAAPGRVPGRGAVAAPGGGRGGGRGESSQRAGRGGGAEPARRAGDFGTLLVRRGAFTPAEVQRAREFGAANGYQLATGSEAERALPRPRPARRLDVAPPGHGRPPLLLRLPALVSVWRGDLPAGGPPAGPRGAPGGPPAGPLPRGGRAGAPLAPTPRVVRLGRRLASGALRRGGRAGLHAGRDGPPATPDAAAGAAGALARRGPGWPPAGGRPGRRNRGPGRCAMAGARPGSCWGRRGCWRSRRWPSRRCGARRSAGRRRGGSRWPWAPASCRAT